MNEKGKEHPAIQKKLKHAYELQKQVEPLFEEALKKSRLRKFHAAFNMARDAMSSLANIKKSKKLIQEEVDAILPGAELTDRDENNLKRLEMIQAFEAKKGSHKSIFKPHDEAAKVSRRVAMRYFEYNYNEKERLLNTELMGYSFKLPKNSTELLDIGESMDICVPDYEDMILSKDCLIVAAYEDEMPVLCLEISSSGQLRQAKKYANKLLDKNNVNDKKLIKALNQFIEKFEIELETYDLENAA